MIGCSLRQLREHRTMSTLHKAKGKAWCIVVADDHGPEFVPSTTGVAKMSPVQYCGFGDPATLLQKAMHRALRIAHPVRFVPTLKTVKEIHPATRDDIGDLTTRRPLPSPTLNRLGAFLFLNHHGPQTYAPGNHGLPFGPHPHRGFETVTFILDGALAHRDSAGHESVIRAGGVQ
jgi:hypothetical protein